VASPLKRLVGAVQVVAAASFVLMVVMLVVMQPTKNLTALPPPTSPPSGQNTAVSVAVDGAQVFSANCAGCHGRDGGGGIGPELRDGAVLDAFEDAASEISFVKAGAPGMPAFANRLSEAELEAVVEFTRTTLQSK